MKPLPIAAEAPVKLTTPSTWQFPNRRSTLKKVTALLEIRTITAGLYEGFNPIVAVVTKLLVALLVGLMILFPDGSGVVLDQLTSATIQYFANWYNLLLAAVLVFCLVLVVLPVSGRIVLGPDGSVPEHGTISWLSMMFCAGIGVGILTFSVSEPVSHFVSNPDIIGAGGAFTSEQDVRSALQFTYLHWGLTAWASYSIVGLSLGLACHRYGQPLTMRSGVAPLFGKRLEGLAGHTIDIVSILAIISGICTTIVLGLEQICSGLSVLSGSTFFVDQTGNPQLIALLTALVASISVAIASVVSGVERGVKWVSQIGVLMAFVILSVFVIWGGGPQVFGLALDASLSYLRDLPAQMTRLYDGSTSPVTLAQRDWQNEWTLFYWAWWIAFAPFVGLFLTRISRGRSIRHFILGATLGPTAMCFVWFAGTGGSALLMELDGTAGGAILSAEHAFRIYETVDLMLSPDMATVLKAAIVFLFLILIVASTTAAIIAIKFISAAGSNDAEASLHSIIWAVVIAAITGAVMTVGGVGSIRGVMIVGAVPFSIIMALMLLSTLLTVLMIARK
jgi:glycine betaine transporter